MLFGTWLATTKPPHDDLLFPIIAQLEPLVRSEIVLKQKDGNVFLIVTLYSNFILGSSQSYKLRMQQAIFDLPARAHFLS